MPLMLTVGKIKQSRSKKFHCQPFGEIWSKVDDIETSYECYYFEGIYSVTQLITSICNFFRLFCTTLINSSPKVQYLLPFKHLKLSHPILVSGKERIIYKKQVKQNHT